MKQDISGIKKNNRFMDMNMVKRYWLLAVICLLIPEYCLAVMPLPARIGGTVTIDGDLLTQAGGEDYRFEVKRSNGESLIPASQSTGLNSSGWYIVDVPISEFADQSGGAQPGENLMIHVYDNDNELNVTSPANGLFVCGDAGSITVIDVGAQVIVPAQQAPVANAGPDQEVEEGDIVFLDGSASSDADGSIVSYLWTQTEGAAVEISDPNDPNPSFTAPAFKSDQSFLTFRLTVTDDDGFQGSDECVVQIIKNDGGDGGGCFIKAVQN
jgi:hypothetical protein